MGKRQAFQQMMLAQLERHMQKPKNKNETPNSIEVPVPIGKGGIRYPKYNKIARHMTPNVGQTEM